MKTKILKYPNKKLKRISKRVSTDEGREIAEKLKKVTDSLCCDAGLSAIQIGIPARVFIFVKKAFLELDKYVIAINPTIESHSREKTFMNESCFSCPDEVTVKRWKSIKVRYHDGQKFVKEELIGKNARIFQHEYDHLDGILICDPANKNVI